MGCSSESCTNIWWHCVWAVGQSLAQSNWTACTAYTGIPGLVACGDGKEVRAVAMIWDTGSKTGEVTGHTKQARLRKCIQMGFLLFQSEVFLYGAWWVSEGRYSFLQNSVMIMVMGDG